MTETTPSYAGDAGDEVQGDPRPIGLITACRRIRAELEENLTYARLYLRLSKKARNHDGEQQWQDQVDQLVTMLAELDKEEKEARAGSVRLQETRP